MARDANIRERRNVSNERRFENSLSERSTIYNTGAKQSLFGIYRNSHLKSTRRRNQKSISDIKSAVPKQPNHHASRCPSTSSNSLLFLIFSPQIPQKHAKMPNTLLTSVT